MKYQLFTLNFTFKLGHVSVSVAHIGSIKSLCNSLIDIFIICLCNLNIEQNRMIRTTQDVELFYKESITMLPIFDIIVGTIFERRSCK